ncbi:LOW QUALITY PROTEIN: hypothetical protein CRUP_002939 [Coryphaenoides rupestris]|nr:LOW QUALITY PROTEIN: hypothetical protein CRUP_002939 [Coryphaenoides rupestris]
MRSHRKSKVCAASSLSSLSGSQASQWGRISGTLAHSGRKRITLPTAEMQFSVALTFSLERDSAAWMAPTSKAMASGRRTAPRGGNRLTGAEGPVALAAVLRHDAHAAPACRTSGLTSHRDCSMGRRKTSAYLKEAGLQCSTTSSKMHSPHCSYK